MDSEQDATEAIKALNGRDVKGRRMKVEMSTGVGRDDRRSQTTQKLFVGNVADGTTDQQLRDLFEAHITVVEADVIDNKNFGFVHVDLGVSSNSRDGRNKLDEILNLVSGAELNGNRLRIQKSEGGGDRGGCDEILLCLHQRLLGRAGPPGESMRKCFFTNFCRFYTRRQARQVVIPWQGQPQCKLGQSCLPIQATT